MQESFGEPVTIDEIATLTDEGAVRRRFDAHNTTYMTVVSVIFVIAGVVVAISSVTGYRGGHMLRPGAGLFNFALSAFIAVMFTRIQGATRRKNRKEPSRLMLAIARNLPDWIVGLLVMHFSTFLIVSGRKTQASMVWAMTYPWIIIGLRLSLPRRLTLHLAMIILAIVAVETGPVTKPRAQTYASAVAINAFVFAAGAYSSRRLRLQTIEAWADRRIQAREQVRMRDELQLAREVQLSMLPDAPPRVPWLDIAASSMPASEVGGDYYDYFQVGDSIAVVCGDVAGHGLASGIVLATLRSGFTLLRDSLSDPAAVLERLHDLIAHTSRRRMLATAAVVLLDPMARRARIASAGHPPIVFATDGSVRSIELFAPPLGVRLPVRIAQSEVPFAAGDAFVMHSDGIYETRNGLGETYGLERLERVVAQTAGSATELRDAILQDVEKFRGAAAQDDDITIVVLKVGEVGVTS